MVILNKALLFILTLFSTLIFRSRTQTPNIRPYPTTRPQQIPVIKSISTGFSPNATNEGPISGLNTLYIRGTSLTPDYNNLKITLGTQDCPLNLAYSTDFQLACTVPAVTAPGKVDVKVTLQDTPAICAPNVCEYNYVLGATPYINDFRPSAILSTGAFMASGDWFDADPYNIKVALEGTICPLVTGTLNEDMVQCNPSGFPAGYYNIDVSVPRYGSAFKTPTSKVLADADYQPHDIAVIPVITGINSNTAPVAGQTITITGKGFSNDPANNHVFYEDFGCDIISSSTNVIQCTLTNPPIPASNTPRPGHGGLIHRTYPRAESFAELKTTVEYLGRDRLIPETYERLAAFEIDYKLPSPFDSEVVEGYFLAPATGKYRFLLSAEGQAELYISSGPLIYTNSSMTKIAEVTDGTDFRHFFDPEESNQISGEIDLEEGKYYYLQTFHNSDSPNHLTVGVTYPNTYPNPQANAFNAKEVISVKINAEVNRLEMVLTIHDTDDDITFVLGSLESEAFEFPGDQYIVENALADIDIEADVLTQVFLDDSNTEVDEVNATKVRYTVRFYTAPDFADVPTLGDGITGDFVPAQGNTVSSDYVSGSYELTYQGKAITFNFDATESDVEDALNEALGVQFATRVFKHGRSEEGAEYIIYFDGITGDVAQFTVSQNDLTGGESAVTIDVTVLQEASSDNIVLPVIPPHLLRTYETEPQILVLSNGFHAACHTNCRYTTSLPSEYPEVVNFVRDSSSLTITLKNAANKVAADFDRVFFAGNVAKVENYDPTTQVLTATLPLLPSGHPRLVAGIQLPQVRIKSVGYAVVSPQFVEVINVNVDSAHAIELSNGLVEVTVEGSGFGVSLTERYGTVVDIGGMENCPLTSLSNTKLVCRTDLAVATHSLLGVTVNKMHTSTEFNFRKNLATKALTDGHYLDITGQNFNDGTTVTFINDNSGEAKPCYPCILNTTFIRCDTVGLSAGTYTAVVAYGAPSTTPHTGVFFTVEHDVTSITPTTGSVKGGTVLTITGKGFDTDMWKNGVEITNDVSGASTACNILTASQTQITCQIPSGDIAAGAATVKVTRDIIFATATCSGGCSFEFTASSTPTVDSATPSEIHTGDVVTFVGTNLNSNTQFLFNGKPGVASAPSGNTIAVTVPEIDASTSVQFAVTDPTMGDADIDPSVTFTSPLILTSVSPSAGSLGGNILTLSGKGFSNDGNAGLEVFVGGQPCRILSIKANEFKCSTGAITVTDGEVVISQGDFDDITCATCKFSSASGTTPIINSLVINDDDSSLVTITVQGTSLNLGTPSISLVADGLTRQATITSSSATEVVGTIADLEAGSYEFTANFGGLVPVLVDVDETEVQVPIVQSATPVSKVVVSQAGGREVTFNFNTNKLPLDNEDFVLTIGGFECPITSSTATQITCTLPPLSTLEVSPEGEEELLTGDIFSTDSTFTNDLAFDGSVTTFWAEEPNTASECFIGLDLGLGLVAVVTEIEFYPRTSIDPSELQGGVFEGSNDGENYVVIADTEFTNIYEGWNYVEPESEDAYRYIRYRSANSSGSCGFAELRFTGIYYSDITVTNPDVVLFTEALLVIDENTNATLATQVEYRKDATPNIISVAPRYGPSTGGTRVTMTGTGLSGASAKVFIDGVECTVQSHTDTTLACITGALPPLEQRTSRPTGELEVFIEGKGDAVISEPTFLYANRWSDRATWGCGNYPRADWYTSVESKENILVDMSTPAMSAVYVQGGLYFEDKDIEFRAMSIAVFGGVVQIGTPYEPIQSKITITLSGDRKTQGPLAFGMKSFGSIDGTINIHGTPRFLQTVLNVTAKAGDSSISVESVGDWKVGDYIVISSTSLDPMENEKKRITKITGSKLTLDSHLKYLHLAETEMIGSNGAEIKATVALLTRNVVIQGNEDTSADNFGANIQIAGYDPADTQVRFSYVEIKNVGQAGIDERYPINFINRGNLDGSFISGCSISHSYNKGIQVRGTNNLRITHNTLYDIKGEAIILPDGTERYNDILNNLIIQVTANPYIVTNTNAPKAVKISNPNNAVQLNKVIGASFGAFHLAFPAAPQGGSYGQKVCPQGENLLRFQENSVQSSKSIGFLIDAHYPRKFACESPRDNGAAPFAVNPSETNVYSSLSVSRAERGLQAISVGDVVISEFKAIDNTAVAIEILNVANAPLGSAGIQNSTIIGRIHLGNKDTATFPPTTGILVPESDDFSIENTTFVRVGTAIQTTRGAGSKTTVTEGLQFVDATDKLGLYRHIFEDDDGSVAGTGEANTIVYDFPHLRVPECTNLGAAMLTCDSTVEVRSLSFSGFPQTTMKIVRLEDGVDPNAAVNFTSLAYLANQGIPFVTGYPYWISFGASQELVGGKIELSPLYDDADLPITLAFANTGAQNEFFVNKKVYGTYGSNGTSSGAFDLFTKDGIADKNFGDYHYDSTNKILYVAVTGKDTPDIEDPADASFALILAGIDNGGNNGTNGNGTGNGTNPGNGTGNGTDPGNGTNPGNGTGNGTDPGNSTGNGTDPGNGTNPGNGTGNGTDPGNSTGNGTDPGNSTGNGTNPGNGTGNGTDPGNSTGNGTNPGNSTGNGTDPGNGTGNGNTTNPGNTTNNNTNQPDPGDPTPVVLPYRLWSDASGWDGGALPQAGQDVTIDADDVVMLDTATPNLGLVNILGTLMLSDNVTSVSLSAKKIAVRGKLLAGNSTHPFAGDATIRLTGTSADSSLMLNGTTDVGTKLMLVTGELSLYGDVTASTLTRLAANAASGSTIITVDGNIADYSVNDQILIVASGANAGESELNTIASIDYTAKRITLQTPIQYFHYGASAAKTVGNSMTLDMRAEVINLQRNIKIVGSTEGTLGARILVTSENNGTQVKTGVVNMYYVSISNAGDAANSRAALAFTNTAMGTATSTLKDNVFLNPLALSVSFSQAKNVNFQHNTIYQARQYGIRFFSNNNNVQVTSNMIIGVTALTTAATPLASSAGITIQDGTSTNVAITSNIVAGCAVSCYLIRGPVCNTTNYFTKNVAHSGNMGQIVFTDLADGTLSCILVSEFTAYRMQYGVISDTPVTEIQASKLTMADNSYSVNLVTVGSGIYFANNRYPYHSIDGVRYIIISDSYFAGVGLTDCPACYSQASTCSAKYAIGFGRFTSTLQNASYVSNRLQVLGSAYKINSNIFENFSDSLVSGCVDNKVFVLSSAARDVIAEITTDQNTVVNTNPDSLALFQSPSTTDNSNCGPGGQCTLQLNTIIRDDKGTLTGNGKKPTSLIPNNAAVVDASRCTFHSKINGYICEEKDMGLLSVQVMDDNKYSTTLSPVTFTSTGFSNRVISHRNNYANTTNDTQKFISLVQNDRTYQVTFTGSVPREVVFEYEAMTGDSILVTVNYPSNKRALITNLVSETAALNAMTKTTNAGVIEATDPCGTYLANNVTGDVTVKMVSGPDCKIIFEKRNSIVLRLRFSMPLAEFTSKNLLSSFINKIAEILGISNPARVRIVQVYSGSTGIITAIDGETQGDDSYSSATGQLANYQTQLNTALSTGRMDLDGNSMNILESDIQAVYATDPDSTPSNPTTTPATTNAATEPDSPNLIWLAIVLPIIVVLLIVVPLVLWKLKKDRARKYELKRLPLPQIDGQNEIRNNDAEERGMVGTNNDVEGGMMAPHHDDVGMTSPNNEVDIRGINLEIDS